MEKDYKGLAIRFIKFALTSLVGAGVDFVLVWFLDEYLFSGYVMEYVVAPVISFEASVLVGFTANYYLIWYDRIEVHDSSAYLKRLAGYNLSCIGVFLIKMGLLLLLERCFGWKAFVCNIIARMLSGLLNFVMGEKVIFKKQ